MLELKCMTNSYSFIIGVIFMGICWFLISHKELIKERFRDLMKEDKKPLGVMYKDLNNNVVSGEQDE